jgi:hypothetical protein
MSHGIIGSNRFDALAQGESPEKRPNTSTTPEAFKLMEADCTHPVSLGPPAVAVPAKSSIERINGAKRRPPPPRRRGTMRRVCLKRTHRSSLRLHGPSRWPSWLELGNRPKLRPRLKSPRRCMSSVGVTMRGFMLP